MRPFAACLSLAGMLIFSSLCLAGTRHVVVTTVEQGQPKPGVTVSLQVGEAKKLTATSDARGTASFEVTEGPASFAKVVVSQDGCTTLGRYWNPAGDDQTLPLQWLFAMEPASQIAGLVVDDTGAPLVGAHVVLEVNFDKGRSDYAIVQQFHVTDAHGKWEATDVPAICKSIELAAWHYDCLPADGFFYQEPFEPQSKLRDGSATLVLHRGVPVHGTVRSADGEPFSSAKVFYSPDRHVSNAIAPVLTDTNGNFSLGIPAGSDSQLIVEAPGYAPAMQRFHVDPSLKPLEIILGPTHVLAGRLIDAAGRGVSDATVSITNWQGRNTLDQQLHTDHEGRFSWAGAPADTVQASIYGQGLARIQDVNLKAGDANEIHVVSEMKVNLTVLDSKTGQPIESYNIRRGNIWHTGERLIWQPDHPGVIKKMGKGQCVCTLDDAADQYVIRIEADGHYSADTPAINSDGNAKTFTLKLDPAADTLGHVVMSDGSAVGTGKVYFATEYFMVRNGNEAEFAQVTADITDDGSFTLRPQREKGKLLIITDRGAGQWNIGDWENKTQLTLQPWAKVTGQIFRGDQPLSTTSLSGDQFSDEPETDPIVRWDYNFSTDEQGRFTLDHVWPGKLIVQQTIPNHKPRRMWGLNLGELTVHPGENAAVELGKTGSQVVGHLAMNFSNRPWMIRLCEAKSSANAGAMKLTPTIGDDGQLQIENAPPGTYALHISLNEWSPGDSCGWGGTLGEYKTNFTVPPITPGQHGSMVDIGSLASIVNPDETLNDGAIAPTFTAKTLDRRTISLEDYKGKVVLLDFWATWCTPCVNEMPNLKKVRDAHQRDARLIVLGMNSNEETDISIVKSYTTSQHFDWPQVLLGPESDIAKTYAATAIPMTILIGPDGHVVAHNLRGDALNIAVEQALTKTLNRSK